jgi:hypothetical protein
MKTFNKRALLASVAIASLGMSSQAFAFDSVNWEWNKTINETVNITSDINVDVDPSGMVQIEKIQANIGDVTATSTVSGINNNAAGSTEGGTAFITIDETVTVQTNFPDPNGTGQSEEALNHSVLDDGESEFTVTAAEGVLAEGANGFNHTVDVNFAGEFEIELDEIGTLDAEDLPKVESLATAVANNQSIESASPLFLHDGQYNFGGFNVEGDSVGGADLEEVLAATPDTGNTHTDIAGGLTIAAALGIINQGEVSATSDVSEIVNASVESAATAVGNNFSAEVNASTASDALVIADITQWNYANTTATSTVTDVELNNYVNFGGADMGPLAETQIPIVSSVATAVGNNFSLTVNAPAAVVPTP